MQPTSATELAQPVSVLPDNHASLYLSWGVVIACSLAWLVQILRVLILATRRRRAARAAEASHDSSAALVPGNTVLRGCVEYSQDADHAVRVEVEQHGTEHESSGSWSHKWTEVGRRVRVAPFYLRGASGQRVRVEPPANVQLIDALDGKVLVDQTTRIRTATLVPGEVIYVRGALVSAVDPEAQGGYRGAPVLVLRAAPYERMQISSEPLGAGYARRSRLHRGWALVMAVALVLSHASLVKFHALTWNGRTSAGIVEGLRYFVTTDSENDDTHHYEVTVRIPSLSARLVDEVDERDYERLQEGSRVAVRSAAGMPRWRTLGAEASVHAVHLVLLLVLVVLLNVGYPWHRRASRPWYLRPVEDSASGRLPPFPPVPPGRPRASPTARSSSQLS